MKSNRDRSYPRTANDPLSAEFFEREAVCPMHDERSGNSSPQEVFNAEYRVLGGTGAGSSRFQTQTPPPRPPQRINYLRPLILFLLTVVSTYMAGGWMYALAVMSILLFHEFGHYLQCRRYGVPSTLPYFIPMPLTPIGTMGAVIVQQSGVANRKQMFDIAISGPLAGLVIAIPALVWGLSYSKLEPLPFGEPYLRFGEPLLIQWIIWLKFGAIPIGYDTTLHPVAFAGWVGIFITALNLIPIGQLDGGHILYCLLGKPARTISLWLWRGAVCYVLINYWRGTGELMGWLVMLGLLGLMGVQHPPTANDGVPLGPVRTILGWITLPFIIIGFTPNPIEIVTPQYVWNFFTQWMIG